MPQAAITVVIGRTYIHFRKRSSVTMPQAAITVVIKEYDPECIDSVYKLQCRKQQSQ